MIGRRKFHNEKINAIITQNFHRFADLTKLITIRNKLYK